MRIDAHQHFWSISRTDYGWLTPDVGPIYRDFLPDDLAPLLKKAGLDGTVLVQAAPTLAETEYLLDLARDNDFIKGVVGWVDFESPSAPDNITRLAANPKFVGLRPMIQDIPDDDWMLKPGLGAAFESLIAENLTFEALTFPRHLKNLMALFDHHPDMRIVIDHGSKPQIRSNEFDAWAGDMAQIASTTNAFCKISGLVTEASEQWTVEDLRPYVDHLLSTFGPDRLIWGSDWPVCLLASNYEQWLEVSANLLGTLTPSDHDAVFGGNAQRAYLLS